MENKLCVKAKMASTYNLDQALTDCGIGTMVVCDECILHVAVENPKLAHQLLDTPWASHLHLKRHLAIYRAEIGSLPLAADWLYCHSGTLATIHCSFMWFKVSLRVILKY